MEQLLVSILSGLITGIATAYITVRFALRRFRAEKWRERKAKSYVCIIESLHHMKNPIDLLIDAERNEE